MRRIQTTSSMNKIAKFFKKIKVKNAIKSLNSSDIEFVVAVLLVRSIYLNNNTKYKTLVKYIEEFDGAGKYKEGTDYILNQDDDLVLEVLDETSVRSEKLSKLLRQCSARKIKNPVILALTIEE